MMHSTRAILVRTTRFAFRAVVDACRFRARESIFAANIFFLLLENWKKLFPHILNKRERCASSIAPGSDDFNTLTHRRRRRRRT
jgi:hypothetical protein